MRRGFNITETGYTYGYPMNSIEVNKPYTLPNYGYPYNYYQMVWRIPQKKGEVIFTYTDKSGTIQTYNYDWDYTISTNAEGEIMRLECGYSTMQEAFPDMDLNKGYTFRQVVEGNTLGVYYIEPQKCNGNQLYPVKFLNKWGIWDYLFFTGRIDENMSTDYDTFKYNNVDYSTMSYELSEGSYHKFNNQGKGKFTLNSGFVEENKNEKFKELMLSEFVLIEDIESGWLPYIITDKDIKYKTTKWDKLINYTMTFEFAYDTINKVI